jgi:hypothetical protein
LVAEGGVSTPRTFVSNVNITNPNSGFLFSQGTATILANAHAGVPAL